MPIHTCLEWQGYQESSQICIHKLNLKGIYVSDVPLKWKKEVVNLCKYLIIHVLLCIYVWSGKVTRRRSQICSHKFTPKGRYASDFPLKCKKMKWWPSMLYRSYQHIYKYLMVHIMLCRHVSNGKVTKKHSRICIQKFGRRKRYVFEVLKGENIKWWLSEPSTIMWKWLRLFTLLQKWNMLKNILV